ncbi:TetR/AcrR family transcriptional regulator [Nocardia sp. NBC_00565]|uniref:TetR/AcrR family transcriptional regulator n=1 Tax=Nocardia sp. NBC_00565 TaxID=2975993 RepID=UPI002E80A29D|nr:TetR/AcrR family transcriptional regulator [Nocardia sp. NBC_00565]WUC00796.1 TetR/AcrR family transcriptional regulator [Nocardia sp. NBC_00565]
MPSPTTVELLWGTQQRPKRGPKPALSLEGIVGAAIALADAEGLANLSMQRLAERLGFTKMSLYRYVPGKEQLTALMFDTAMGAPPDMDAAPPDSSEEQWRGTLRRWAQTIFERYTAHPWAIELTTGLRPIGPNEMGWTEAALVALKDTGLNGSERLDTIVLLNGHVRSLAQQVSSAGGDTSVQFNAQFAEMMTAAGDRYPEVVAAFAEEASATSEPPFAGGPDDALNFGIARVLDGLAVLIDQRRGESR